MSSDVPHHDEAADRMRGVGDAAHDAVDQATDLALRSVKHIQERPLRAVAAALFAGVLIGLCLRR